LSSVAKLLRRVLLSSAIGKVAARVFDNMKLVHDAWHAPADIPAHAKSPRSSA
jgi:hypothetical protein